MVVSTTIVVEREEEGHVYKVQWPIYYTSEVLLDSKIRYPYVQKLLYALLITSCKLRHYFESHKITVIIDFPLGDILHNRDATGRISKWEVELGALNIDFTPRRAIKSQALADFVAEWTEIQQPTPDAILDHWKMYFDGSLKLGGASTGVLFISLDRKQLKYILQILWQATNNEAEYEAFIHGLRVAISLGIKRLLVYGDSTVVVNQVNKDWDCSKDNIGAYCAEVRKLEKNFQGLEILHVLRDSNVAADILGKLGSDRAKVPPYVFLEELSTPSIKQPSEITPELLAPATQILESPSRGLKTSSITSKKISYRQIKKKSLR
jgi:ribonuclease HI